MHLTHLKTPSYFCRLHFIFNLTQSQEAGATFISRGCYDVIKDISTSVSARDAASDKQRLLRGCFPPN